MFPLSNYTAVSKTGSNLSMTLTATTRDINGELIREGVSYKVFILTVSNGGNSNNNALSTASTILNLTNNALVSAVTNLTVEDMANAGDGSDLRVRFNKVTNETNILEYRIIVVKAAQVSTFDLTRANSVTSTNYTRVAKTSSNITQRLNSTSRDADGDRIKPDGLIEFLC
ncbi:hypothetical protein KHA80_12645 [Anaerobacillus sp. HL2]|nr:hypothetical protein KHA80_12645 [Anaerobacillus sp. HL2]